MKYILQTVFWLIAMWSPSWAATFTVTKTVDDGTTGTLRWAINQANATAGYDVINFNILPVGNTFETFGTNSWALITITSALPQITETVLIDGSTQPNTNIGSIAGQVVGVDSITQPAISYPDVYIICGYTLPNSENSLTGNGLFINASNVTIRGLAISGFGNRSSTQTTALAHADISIRYSATARTVNTLITDCFISCNPRGLDPSPTSRRSRGGGILILGNNHVGTIERNYIAHTVGYGIIFHGTVDNTSANPNLTPCRGWLVQNNQLLNTGTGSTYSTTNRAADAISLMCVKSSLVAYNYINGWEQFAIDLGHNTDSNRVENNTATGMVSTAAALPAGGIRTAFSSQCDSLIKNVINNNTSSRHLGGIWADESQTSFAGAGVYNNTNFYYAENKIHDNINSGIVLSTNGNGTLSRVTISRNSTYNNTGLGIDLNFTDLTGVPFVTVNDDGDGDTGPNDLLNFPIIDSAKSFATVIHIWGKAPAGSTVEFFFRDAQMNQHAGRILNYGEGRKFIGSATEGSAEDLVTGTGSYNLDGNIATNNANRFYFVIPYSDGFNQDSLTATATLNGNTSEFGPKNLSLEVLNCYLLKFSGVKNSNKTILDWKAIVDKNFSHFVVEHSIDGRSFSSIGNVYPLAADSLNYSFSHLAGLANKLYYRLKMVGNDNTFKYSQIVALGGKSNYAIQAKVLENPFHDHLVVSIDAATFMEAHLKIVAANGLTIASKNIHLSKGNNQVPFSNLFSLPSGFYQLIINAQDEKINIPVIKQ